MDRRTMLKLSAVGVGGTTLAGCLDRVPGVDGDSEASGALSAASVNRREVESTGEIKAFDLYLQTATQQVSPSIEIPVWGFSDSPDGPFEMPGPTLRATAGDEIRVNFNNQMDMKHTIHWHGVHLDWEMDGVPFLSQDPIPGGESFEYVFPAKPPGTHWYHCHVDATHHIDMGMYGTLVFEDPEDPWRVGGPQGVTSDEVLVIDEVDKNHAHNASAYADTQDPTQGSQTGNPMDTVEKYKQLVNDIGNRPPNPTTEDSAGSTNPAQTQRDWYPDTYPAYEPNWDTYLLNGRSFPYTEPIVMKEGEAKRLRLVHAGNLRHSMHIHGHSFLVTHSDGQRLPEPYWKDTLEIAPGERYDVIVFGDNPGAWALHEHSGHANNHNVYPGGIFTNLVYEGFEDKALNQGPPQGG